MWYWYELCKGFSADKYAQNCSIRSGELLLNMKLREVAHWIGLQCSQYWNFRWLVKTTISCPSWNIIFSCWWVHMLQIIQSSFLLLIKSFHSAIWLEVYQRIQNFLTQAGSGQVPRNKTLCAIVICLGYLGSRVTQTPEGDHPGSVWSRVQRSPRQQKTLRLHFCKSQPG